MTRWEYEVHSGLLLGELNLLGGDGWELVSVIPASLSATADPTWVFKRPVPGVESLGGQGGLMQAGAIR